MFHKHKAFCGWVGFAVGLYISQAAGDADWPQFLGPDRNAVAVSAKPLARSWPETGPKELWRVPVGKGYGGASICNDKVFLLDREVGKRDVLRCFRLSDGHEIWQSSYDAPGRLSYEGSRSTPATDGELVYTVGPHGHLRAVKLCDGSPIWQAHVLNDWNARKPRWGVATSPMLLDNKIIVAPWGSQAALVAYDKSDGTLLWKTPNPKGTPQDYASPVIMKLGGKTMIVATGKHSHTIAVDSKTGAQLWSYDGYECRNQIASPVILQDGRVLLTGGYGAGSAMIKIVAEEGGYTAHELWKSKDFGSTISQPIIYDNHIYMNKGFKQGIHGMACISLNGKIKWDTGRTPSFDMGSVFLANELLYAVNGANGDLVMIAPTPTAYHELARARVLGSAQTWAPMALSGTRLLLRDHKNLVCVELAD